MRSKARNVHFGYSNMTRNETQASFPETLQSHGIEIGHQGQHSQGQWILAPEVNFRGQY